MSDEKPFVRGFGALPPADQFTWTELDQQYLDGPANRDAGWLERKLRGALAKMEEMRDEALCLNRELETWQVSADAWVKERDEAREQRDGLRSELESGIAYYLDNEKRYRARIAELECRLTKQAKDDWK
jgi:hypothetical protein